MANYQTKVSQGYVRNGARAHFFLPKLHCIHRQSTPICSGSKAFVGMLEYASQFCIIIYIYIILYIYYIYNYYIYIYNNYIYIIYIYGKVYEKRDLACIIKKV